MRLPMQVGIFTFFKVRQLYAFLQLFGIKIPFREER
jgi:hypothetical protein